MHKASFNLMARLRPAYVGAGSKVLDVGGADVNGSYRPIFADCSYTTLDRAGADILVTGYDWPLEADSFDAVVSGQTLEHDPQFWLTLRNIAHVLKPGGHAIIIVPSTGPVHRYPVDCYRFLPDALEGFARWAGLSLVQKEWDAESPWHDLAGVFRKPLVPTPPGGNTHD